MAKAAVLLIEMLIAPDVNGRVAQQAVELLIARPTASPTTITGGGVSQHCVELLVSRDSPDVHIAQQVVELLITPNFVAPVGTPANRSWVTII